MNEIDVSIGQVAVGDHKTILQTNAIGSCIAVIIFNAKRKTGAMAHIMLAGQAPAETPDDKKTRYADNAIMEIISQLTSPGPNKTDLKAVIVGGGNVLQDHNDNICVENIESVRSILKREGIELLAEAVGGIERRSASFNIAEGIVTCAEGDSKPKLLWKVENTADDFVLP